MNIRNAEKLLNDADFRPLFVQNAQGEIAVSQKSNGPRSSAAQSGYCDRCKDLFSYAARTVTPTWAMNAADLMWDYVKPSYNNLYRSTLLVSFIGLQAYQAYTLQEYWQEQRKGFYKLLQGGSFTGEQFDEAFYNAIKAIIYWVSASVATKTISDLFINSISAAKMRDLYSDFLTTNTFNNRNYLDSKDKKDINPAVVIARDVWQFSRHTVHIFKELTGNIAAIALALANLSEVLDFQLTLICFAFIALIKAVTWISCYFLKNSLAKESLLQEKQVSSFEDVLKSSESITMLKGGEFEAKVLIEAVKESLKAQNLSTIFSSLLGFVSSLKGFISWAGGTYLCRDKLISGIMKMGDAFTIGDALEALINFVTWNDSHADDMIEAENAYERIKAMESEITICCEKIELRNKNLIITKNNEGYISFNGVVYKPNGDVLFRGSIKLTKDEKTGVYRLEGPSGIGKSTLIRVLAGFWLDVEGELCIPENGSIIPQVPFIRGGNTPLIDIIRYPRVDEPSEAEINEIKELLKAFGFADNSDAVAHLQDSTWEIDGKSVSAQWSRTSSGGEKQRFGIISAIIKKLGSLIMDEGTSAMDPRLKFIAEDEIKKHLPNALITFVDHNPSGIHADRMQTEWFFGSKEEILEALKQEVQVVVTGKEELTKQQMEDLKALLGKEFPGLNVLFVDPANNGFADAVIDLRDYQK